MAQKNVATSEALPFAGYIRVSRVNGRAGESFVSPDLQRASVEKTARQHGLKLSEVVEELDVSGGKDAESRELGRLVAEVAAGKLGGVIVWNVKRYSREWRDGIVVFDALVNAGGRLVAEDFSFEGLFARSVLSFLLEGAEEERRQKTETWDRAVAGSIERGIHSGPRPPLGYDWPKIVIDLGDGRTRTKKTGPLVPVEPDATRVRKAFAGFGAENAEERWSWMQTAEALGVTSIGTARRVLLNRAYLGEARSVGAKQTHVKPGAHEALVDVETFARCARRFEDGKRDVTLTTRGPRKARALAKILRCAACGGVLSPDDVMWRCKRPACENRGVGIKDVVALPYVLEQAQCWHAEHHPVWALGREVDSVFLPALESALMEAQAEVLRLEAEIGAELPASAKQKQTVEAALAAIRDHEASFGWIGRTPAQVAAVVEAGDAETLNSFLRETVRIVVSKCGRHATAVARSAEARCEAVFMSPESAPDTVFEGAPGVLADAVADSTPAPVVSGVEARMVEAALARVKP